MKIYLDYVFLVNFLFDFIILEATSILLKLNVKIIRIILGSLVGALSIFLLFIKINNNLLFLLKIIFGLLMSIISFKYKNLKYTLNNFLYIMIISIILGGFLYMLNIEVGYENIGIVFIKNGESLDIFILLLSAILVIVIYLKKMKTYKIKIASYYKVDLYMNNKKIKLNGFLDTGNNLIDPYFHKPVLILNKNIKIKPKNFIFVPYQSLNNKGILKCFIAPKIYIEKVGYKYEVLIGLSNDNFSLLGVDIILNNEIIRKE